MGNDNINDLSYDRLRTLYKDFLINQSYSTATIRTLSTEAFYLWRKVSKEQFWDAVNADNFEFAARQALLKALEEHSAGDPKSSVNNYIAHLSRFRLFL